MANVSDLKKWIHKGDAVNLRSDLIKVCDDWEDSGDDRDLLTLPLFDEVPLLHYACLQKDVSLDIIEVLLEHGCDVNQRSKEGTPMQIIAKAGHCHLVDILLENGAMLESDDEPIFSENSPFYLASLYGQTDIVRKLLSYQPKMVKDDGIRSCLLHGACRGGNIDIVKMWMSPSMNINHPKLFVSTLEDCENGTPLYAACSGNHYDVAKFLYDMGAELTQRICVEFPEIVGHILENCVTFRNEDFCENDQEAGHVAKYKRISLGGFHFSWLASVQETLVELDLSDNSISFLPPEVPWCFPSLQLLNVSNNKLTKFSGPLGSVHCVSLSEIHLVNNKLDDVCHEVFQLQSLVTLNLSQNNLKYLVRTHHQQFDVVTQPQDNKDNINRGYVQCSKLSYLNISNNKLEMLPHDYIQKCPGLSTLDVSHNKLVSFPNAWECNMNTLNLSYNELDRCPINLEQFWCGTLRTLRLNNNHLEEINESVVKLGCLVELYAGYNKISRLPQADHWECSQLYLLDLSHNNLGPKIANRRLSAMLRNKREDKQIEEETYSFPSFLGNCLHDLDLSYNNLNQVHPSVSYLVSLHHLDISHNPAIKTLPKELGRLKGNCIIKMDGLNVTNLLKITDNDDQQRSKQVLTNLRNELRQCEKYYKMKLVILGKKDKGKTTLAGILKGQTLGSHHLLGVQRHDIELSPKGSRISLFKKDQPSIKFSVWDLSGDPTVSATHHCFYTPNSLYILVWDLWSIDKELDVIGQYLYSIQARMPTSSILLVATFLDRNTLPTKQKDVQDIKQHLLDRYGPEGDKASGLSSKLDSDSFIPVSCTTGEGISDLKEKLYEHATRLPDPENRPHPLLGRSIPKSYLSLEAAIIAKLESKNAEKRQPFLEQQEYLEIISKIPNNDIDSPDEILQATKFLTCNGTILHFNDQLKGLNNLYFLDPGWLCDVLSKVLLHVARDPNVRGGKISKAEVRRIFNEDPRFPDEYVEQYIQLMERFEIALSVDFGGKLFIPSQLSKYPAIELNRSEQQGLKVIRLYKMAFIPTGFWSRLLSRLMYRIELLTTDWILNKSFASSVTPSKFQRMLERQSSSSGLQIVKRDMIYWEDGLYLGHESGCFVVESTIVPQGKGSPHSGVLITVQSTKGDYSIMGIVVDEIDDLLNDHYPGLMEWDEFGQPRVQRFAMCPVCYDSTKSLPEHLDHFSVEHCARLIMSSDTITCPKNLKIPLVQLVPELLMEEIPKKFKLDVTRLSVDTDKLLGIGVAGKVLKGKYGDVDVAVKLYHGAPQMAMAMLQLSSLDSNYHTGGDNDEDEVEQDDIYKNYSAYSIDADETNSMKAWRAFMEMRQEVLVTSKLHYPYIVSFLGISVRPSLLMCLEFAPLGNLRTIIDSAIVHREPFNKYRDKDKIFPAVFHKEETYKILYQVASGLGYLHKYGIIYRDLKSDNVLVFSRDLDSPVNVKLSDYGISRFCSSGGTVGLVGTPGYQAPEIIEGQAYDEKVDIFSYSMLMYEVLSGRRPFEEYKNLAQISRAIKMESRRPCLQEYNIDPGFPYIEDLMRSCWDKSAEKRPSADDITSESVMRSTQFIAFKKIFKLPCALRDGPIDCVSFTIDSRKENIWLWEGADDSRRYTTLDKYTTADNNGYVPRGESLPGNKVTCMCQVDKDIWIGTEGFKIETFSHQCFVKKEKKPLCTFPTPYALATSIVCIKEDSQEEKKVYATLDTGKVMVFEPVNKIIYKRTLGRKVETSEALCGWRITKTLTIGTLPATCMVYIPPNGQTRNEMWIGCGDSICVVSDSTGMVEDRVHFIQCIKQPVPNPSRMIKTLVFDKDRVWCLISDTFIVIEFDVDLRLPTYIFKMEDYCPSGFIVSEYISGISMGASTESLDIVSSVFQSWPSIDIQSQQTQNFLDNQDAIKSNIETIIEPPPVPRRTHSTRGLCNQEATTPPPVPSRSPKRPPVVPPRSPALPLRSPGPSLTTDYITVPDRKSSGSISSVNDSVRVCSVVHVGDTLWVGRNLGDILIINVGQGNSFQYGEVISILKVSPSAHLGNDVESLLSSGNSVISFSKTGNKKGEIITWEPYTSQDILRIQSYWSLKKARKGSTQPVVENLGTY